MPATSPPRSADAEPRFGRREPRHSRDRVAPAPAVLAPARRRRASGRAKPALALLGLALAGLLAGVLLFDRTADEPRFAPSVNGPASISVGGQSVATGSLLTPFVGQRAALEGVRVQQVDGNAGFFVGGGKGKRTFVEWRPHGDRPVVQIPKRGDRVDVRGIVSPAPRQPGRTLGVGLASERVILKQGGYVNADAVRSARAVRGT